MTAPKEKGAPAPTLPDPPPVEDAETPPAPAADTPPKKSSKTKSTGRPPGRPRNTPKLADRIEGMVGGIGVAVMPFNFTDGQIIVAGAPELATALDQWAAENPAVRKTLERMLEATTAGAVFIAVAKMALPIAANHNLLPGDFAAMGVGPLAGGVADPPSNGNNGATPSP